MSQDFASILSAGSTDDVLDVDTSFLDAYRHGGEEGLKKEQEAQDRRGQEARLEAERGAEVDRAPAAERGGAAGGDTAASSTGRDPEPDPEHSEVDEVVDDAFDEPKELHEHDGADHGDELDDDLVLVSLQKTDHQEAVQAAAARTRGSSGDAGSDPLPRTGFRLDGVARQPNIKSLPDSIIDVLREQLRSAAVRELDVTDAAARDFTDRLAQGTLVTAFLIAQLDLRMAADASTERAVELFRSRDPLLGSVAARMDALEARERRQEGLMKALAGQVAEAKETAAVVEQALAYLIADRTENFLRGSHSTAEAPIGHKTAVLIRDRARDATKKVARTERERDGRPIR